MLRILFVIVIVGAAFNQYLFWRLGNSSDLGAAGSPVETARAPEMHAHADFKVFVDGEEMDFSDKAHKSSLLHVDEGAPAPEKTGDVLHMHASGVQLSVFFRSIGMDLGADRLKLTDGRELANGGGKTLKFFVNGKPADRLDTYVFNDLDKILISYGPENDPAVAGELRAVTDFAKNH